MFARGRTLFCFVFKRLALAVNVLGTAVCRGNRVVFFPCLLFRCEGAGDVCARGKPSSAVRQPRPLACSQPPPTATRLWQTHSRSKPLAPRTKSHICPHTVASWHAKRPMSEQEGRSWARPQRGHAPSGGSWRGRDLALALGRRRRRKGNCCMKHHKALLGAVLWQPESERCASIVHVYKLQKPVAGSSGVPKWLLGSASLMFAQRPWLGSSSEVCQRK